jgi:hypothetical protein
MRRWIVFIVEYLANPDPYHQPNQSALPLTVEAIDFNQCKLGLNSRLVECRSESPPTDGGAILPAEPSGMPQATIIQRTVNSIQQRQGKNSGGDNDDDFGRVELGGSYEN